MVQSAELEMAIVSSILSQAIIVAIMVLFVLARAPEFYHAPHDHSSVLQKVHRGLVGFLPKARARIAPP
jgi:hypothetical protein